MLLYLIRHGQTDWNRERRIMGTADIPLNRFGRRTVGELAGFLAKERIQALYTGTIARTLETAGILGEVWKVKPVEDERLNESNYDRWAGKRYDEMKGDPDFDLYSTAPTRADFSSGETMLDIQDRALKAVGRIIGESNGEKAALVSHSDVIKPVIVHYLRMSLDDMHRIAVANASVSLIDIGAPEHSRVRYVNLMPWKWLRDAELDR